MKHPFTRYPTMKALPKNSQPRHMECSCEVMLEVISSSTNGDRHCAKSSMPAALGCKASGISSGCICTGHHIMGCLPDRPIKLVSPYSFKKQSAIQSRIFTLSRPL